MNDRVPNDEELRLQNMIDTIKLVEDKLFTPIQRYTPRLLGLEDSIILAQPDYCEAAESILAPMMAALESRYDWRENKSYQQMGEVKEAYKKLRDALMAAQEAEES